MALEVVADSHRDSSNGVGEQFFVGTDGNLVKNSDYVLHVQQDKLLASWLLLIVPDKVLVHLTNSRTSFDVWATIEKMCATKSPSRSQVYDMRCILRRRATYP
ncbi:hypothetical protein J1N35_037809 [Gossypium stocksii]|uniref:Retrotransposon Copia-like N-terminal domain-containing protein n=1 Tax=Gossypium stocksii TaxID=47602 RepID=A0A9D3UL80_9ROSI|nr:hypothetical protein J1N35_037809 [Gossypium stocksii]